METKDSGEDEQRRQRNILAKKILSDGDEEYKLNCICTLLESQQELASLREQLAKERESLKNLMDQFKYVGKSLKEANEQLKQKEDENRELVEWMEKLMKTCWLLQADYDKLESIIGKHKKNLSA